MSKKNTKTVLSQAMIIAKGEAAITKAIRMSKNIPVTLRKEMQNSIKVASAFSSGGMLTTTFRITEPFRDSIYENGDRAFMPAVYNNPNHYKSKAYYRGMYKGKEVSMPLYKTKGKGSQFIEAAITDLQIQFPNIIIEKL